MTEFENAVIYNAKLEFEDVCGKNGKQFVLKLFLKTRLGGIGVSFNPLRLPQLLELVGCNGFDELMNKPVQMVKTDLGEECTGIANYLDSDKFMETENNVYFGSNFMEMIKYD